MKKLLVLILLTLLLAIPSLAPQAQPLKAYTGRKISLDFVDADIRNILRFIAIGVYKDVP